MIVTLILLVIAITAVAYFVNVYNGLVRLQNNIKKAWGNIEVLLKQRNDEIPKLVDTVKEFMEHEKQVLKDVSQARKEMMNADSVNEKAEADQHISGALKSLFAVAEDYPDLKSNENFLQLQNRISGLENEIADRREFYNDSVNQYNIRIQSIPDVVVASMLGYRVKEMFEVSEADKQDLEVEF